MFSNLLTVGWAGTNMAAITSRAKIAIRLITIPHQTGNDCISGLAKQIEIDKVTFAN